MQDKINRLAPSARVARDKRLVDRLLSTDVNTYMDICREEFEKYLNEDSRSAFIEDMSDVICATFTPPITKTVNVDTMKSKRSAYGEL